MLCTKVICALSLAAISFLCVSNIQYSMPGPMATAIGPFSARLTSTCAPAWSKVLALEHVMLQEKAAE